MRRTAFWLLVAVTLGVYAAIVAWSLPYISGEAGGLIPFDMRPGGYDETEARAFLTALSAEGRAWYLGPQRWLDLAYPPLIALTLFFGIAWAAAGLGRWRWIIAAPALFTWPLDTLENAAVRAMLEAGPSLTGDLVATASRWTVLKSGLTTAMFVVLIGALVARAVAALVRRRRTETTTP